MEELEGKIPVVDEKLQVSIKDSKWMFLRCWLVAMGLVISHRAMEIPNCSTAHWYH